MVVQYASDLHLEQPSNLSFLEKNPLRPVADILILAGDILPLKDISGYGSFLDRLSAGWEKVIWVPGNHEFYGLDLADFESSFKKNLRSNVHLVHNKRIELRDIQFICTTLWSDITGHEDDMVRDYQDFDTIMYGGKKLSAPRYMQLHQDSLNFLDDTQDVDGQKIVVTHHLPTLVDYPPQYAGSKINSGFATDLSSQIAKIKADYWVYGHHHSNGKVHKQGNTHFVSNQLGYVEKSEGNGFQTSKTFTVKNS